MCLKYTKDNQTSEPGEAGTQRPQPFLYPPSQRQQRCLPSPPQPKNEAEATSKEKLPD